jgi:hypothetical protein
MKVTALFAGGALGLLLIAGCSTSPTPTPPAPTPWPSSEPTPMPTPEPTTALQSTPEPTTHAQSTPVPRHHYHHYAKVNCDKAISELNNGESTQQVAHDMKVSSGSVRACQRNAHAVLKAANSPTPVATPMPTPSKSK